MSLALSLVPQSRHHHSPRRRHHETAQAAEATRSGTAIAIFTGAASLFLLRSIVEVTNDILKIKQDIEAELFGEAQSWGHAESNVIHQKYRISLDEIINDLCPLFWVALFSLLDSWGSSSSSAAFVSLQYARKLVSYHNEYCETCSSFLHLVFLSLELRLVLCYILFN
ncbi:hypothetical protein RIF29_09295 [Crotalaria pallida]|uniref:Uncharacterized protein n=1 Tax=Crotalaria pallida TaxID=3830 RepID=A0AAN9IJK8_CROPI